MDRVAMKKRVTILSLAWLAAAPLEAAQITIPAGATLQAPGGTIDGGCAALQVAGTANVSAQMPRLHNVTISPGGTFSLSNATASVGGNWSNSGTFTHNGNSTVRFVDECATGPATLTGATSFHNLSFLTSTGRTFTIPVGAAIQVGGTITLTGAPGNPVQVLSANPSQPAGILTGPGATITGTNYVLGPNVTIGPADPPRLVNISTRMQVLTGNDVMIGGFVIGGSVSKTVAIVATGPSLVPFGIANPLANPRITLVRSSDQSVVATNDDWQAAPNAAQLSAAGFAPSNALEAAILASLAPGAYTAIVEGASGGTGVSVIGVYEVDGPQIPLINISTRGRVLTGNDVMIGGFIIQGTGPQTVAIVATGPSLAPFGITSPLANPRITLVRSSDQAVIDSNDDWQTHANASQLSAAGFAPSNALEAGIYTTLQPGAYTAVVEGVGGGTGVSVIGVYKVN
jgi:hypothetical protein